MRRCLNCGARTDGPRCAIHAKAAQVRMESDPARKARKAARYDAEYRRARAAAKALVESEGYTCARGGEYHPPGAAFDLDHLDGGVLAPSCPRHNRSAGGRLGRKAWK